MQLQHIPLDQLTISKMNMRNSRKNPDVSDILPSIRDKGVLQPLLVRKKGKGYEVVAGRRRHFSLIIIEQEDKKADPVPCGIMENGDDAAALEASLIENTARCDPDDMTRYETFSRLVKQGKSPADIAITFGATEIMVKRSLALGNLIPAIRSAYRADKIDADTIRHLTLATEKQQTTWFKLFSNPKERAPQAWQLKQWLFGGEIKTGQALFPLDTYKGTIITDLFGEDGYFDDANEFWKLQNNCIAANRDALLKAGWSEVIICDVGKHLATWEYVKTSKKDGGRVYIEVSTKGEITTHEGLITQKEHDKHQRQNASQNGDTTDIVTRPELTVAAQNYVGLHRHAAVRTALLKQPDIALRLMVTHAIVGSDNWNTNPDPQRTEKESIAESVAKSKSQIAFEAEKKEILKLLNLPKHHHSVTHSNGSSKRAAEVFTALLKSSNKDVMRILTFVMSETLQVGTSIVEMLGGNLSVDMKKCWQPDDTFFELLRDKTAINAMLKHIGGKQVADANVSTTAKVQKKIIADFVSGDGRKKVMGWLPNYMAFPFKAYTKAGAGQLSSNARQAIRT